jgi:hypothetical protein
MVSESAMVLASAMELALESVCVWASAMELATV